MASGKSLMDTGHWFGLRQGWVQLRRFINICRSRGIRLYVLWYALETQSKFYTQHVSELDKEKSYSQHLLPIFAMFVPFKV
ncbi:hypothetical protein RRG08_030726 [Elysia crispata]|uniref:Uncharacterized protein n=1 Tax=Elysia crispata TaxID=231223 RepID=A0AAE0Y5A6_9GAST|nr:hypothetical protein RRG08_030726 [Elysia crispata]